MDDFTACGRCHTLHGPEHTCEESLAVVAGAWYETWWWLLYGMRPGAVWGI